MHHRHNHKDKGEMVVCDDGNLEIKLHKTPTEVHVAFKHHHRHPCNPDYDCDDDNLEWEVHEPGFFNWSHRLIISWNVSDAREIEWSVEY